MWKGEAFSGYVSYPLKLVWGAKSVEEIILKKKSDGPMMTAYWTVKHTREK